MALNYLAYLAFIEEDYERAINYYDAILNEPDVTLPIRLSSLETLIQLELVFENFEGAEYRVEKELSIQGPAKDLCKLINKLNKKFSPDLFFQSPCS